MIQSLYFLIAFFCIAFPLESVRAGDPPAPPPGIQLPGGGEAAGTHPPPMPPPQAAERTGISGMGFFDSSRQVRNADPCPTSTQINGQYSCTGTTNAVQFSNMANMMTQMTGSAAATSMGATAQSNAYNQGSQKAALEGAANTQIKTGEITAATGLGNAVIGAGLLYQYQKHNSQGRQIQTATNQDNIQFVPLDANGQNGKEYQGNALHPGNAGHATSENRIQQNTINNFRLNQAQVDIHNIEGSPTATSTAERANFTKTSQELEKQLRFQKMNVADQSSQIGSSAASEQAMTAQGALMGGMMSFMTGAQQMVSGGINIQSGKQLQAAAANLNTTSTFKPAALTLPTLSTVAGTPMVARAAASISGSGAVEPTAAPSDSAAAPGPVADLGPGIGPGVLPSNLPTGPQAGGFTPGGTPNPGGGASNGQPIKPGGGTSAASASQEDPQAKLAPTQGGSGYESGSTFSGGGSGGAKAPDGPDLSSLLAKFLPQKEDPTNQNGILDYGSKLASDQPDGSILGRGGPTLFQRATSAYIDKFNHGNIRLN